MRGRQPTLVITSDLSGHFNSVVIAGYLRPFPPLWFILPGEAGYGVRVHETRCGDIPWPLSVGIEEKEVTISSGYISRSKTMEHEGGQELASDVAVGRSLLLDVGFVFSYGYFV